MKKFLLSIAMLTLAAGHVSAETHVITISGTTYTPALVDAVVGDEVTISASGSHPLVQVSQATWDASGNTPLAGGWGSLTTAHTFTITADEDIYFVCSNHVGMGMKGRITVSIATGVDGPEEVAALHVYPNPVTDGRVNFTNGADLPDGSILELYGANGQMVTSALVRGRSASIGTSLTPGIYTGVVLCDGKAVLRQRLMVVGSGQ
ncbi:MAG: T9SS type A sorting domain-containing protein [Flavobacteriales bacterium]|nr:T9SS type A sorting domain-containing protein [Flavobacteriales bacterium]